MKNKTAFIMCGALGTEVVEIVRANDWEVDIYGVPAIDHMHPERISPDVEKKIQELKDQYPHILVVYGDCGTGGMLDRMLEQYPEIDRIAGPHCYEMYAGPEFQALMDEEPGTFFLTDFLVRGFKGTILKGLGLDRFPSLKEDYFRNYERVVYLQQKPGDDLVDKAKAAADYLGLPLEIRQTGYNLLEKRLAEKRLALEASPAG